MTGYLEVVHSDLPRRELRLVIAAVEEYAIRIFTDGIGGLPISIGQCGLGSDRTQITPESSEQGERFVESLQGFLCRHLPPDGWNVVMGGRVGFAIRSKSKGGVVLRATLGSSDEPASARKSCILLIYRAPSAVGNIPPSILLEREKRTLKSSTEASQVTAQEPQQLDQEVLCHPLAVGDTDKDRKGFSGRTEGSAPANLCTTDTEDVFDASVISRCPEAEKLKRQTSKKQLHLSQFHVTPVVGNFSPRQSNSFHCPSIIIHWGFLQLSNVTQKKEVLDAFERTAQKYTANKSDNIQKLSQLLRDELTIMSGPLWHVIVGREDIKLKAGNQPITMISAEWDMKNQLPTSGLLKIVAFQLYGPIQCISVWDKFLSAAPYAASAFLCLLWLLKSTICSRYANGEKLTITQSIIAKKLCAHNGLEATTAFLFSLFVIIAITKIMKKVSS